jgi:hypothetical protein
MWTDGTGLPNRMIRYEKVIKAAVMMIMMIQTISISSPIITTILPLVLRETQGSQNGVVEDWSILERDAV